jgi:hypothetical protein
MHAIFAIAADLRIEVHSERHDRIVGLTVDAGMNPDEGAAHTVTKVSPRRTETYPLTPATARALASALMGAAAEV